MELLNRVLACVFLIAGIWLIHKEETIGGGFSIAIFVGLLKF